jgi:hypothetical protein
MLAITTIAIVTTLRLNDAIALVANAIKSTGTTSKYLDSGLLYQILATQNQSPIGMNYTVCSSNLCMNFTYDDYGNASKLTLNLNSEILLTYLSPPLLKNL